MELVERFLCYLWFAFVFGSSWRAYIFKFYYRQVKHNFAHRAEREMARFYGFFSSSSVSGQPPAVRFMSVLRFVCVVKLIFGF